MMENPASAAVLDAQWLTLEEALSVSGRSPSTLQRAVKARAVQTKLEKRPGRKSERLYRAEDVENLVSLAPPPSAPGLVAAVPAVKKLTDSVTISSLETALIKWRNAPSLDQKPFLTFAEAIRFTSLSPSFLTKMRREGKIKAVRGGENGAYVYGRKSLEKLAD